MSLRETQKEGQSLGRAGGETGRVGVKGFSCTDPTMG